MVAISQLPNQDQLTLLLSMETDMTMDRAAVIRAIIDRRHRMLGWSSGGEIVVVQNRVPDPSGIKTMTGGAGSSGVVKIMGGGIPAHEQPLHQRSDTSAIRAAPLPAPAITVPNATIEKVEMLQQATLAELSPDISGHAISIEPGKINARCAIFLNNRRPLQSWGDEDALALSALADFQLEVTRFMTDADAPHLMDRTRQYYTTPPSPPKRNFWGAVVLPPPVIDFKSALQADLVVLNDVCVRVKDKIVDVEERIKRLTLDQAIIMAAAKVVSGIDQTTAASRARSLLAVLQTAGMIRQALDNLFKMASKQQEQVDHFLTVLIPQWTLSRGLSSSGQNP